MSQESFRMPARPTCCVLECHKDHREDRTYYNFPRKDFALARQWWVFCDNPSMEQTWDKFICDLHFQDSDFDLIEGKLSKKNSAVPSIKGEELKRKMELCLQEEKAKERSINEDIGLLKEESPKTTITLPAKKKSYDEMIDLPTDNPAINSKNVKITFQRHIIPVDIKERKKFNTLAICPSKNRSVKDSLGKQPKHFKQSENSAATCPKKRKLTHLPSKPSVLTPTKRDDTVYPNKLIPSKVNKELAKVSSPFTLSNSTPIKCSFKKKGLVSSDMLVRKTLRPILPKPEIGTNSSVTILMPSTSLNNTDEIVSGASKDFQEPLLIRTPQNVLVPTSNTNESVFISSHFDLEQNSSFPSNTPQKMSRNIFPSAKLSKSYYKPKAQNLLKSARKKIVEKDAPTIKLKKQKFSRIKKEFETITDFQKRTLSRSYQRSRKKDVDLSDPKFSIASTAKSLDKLYTPSDDTLEKIDLRHGEWNKLFVPTKTTFTPATLKSNTSAIVHTLRQRLPHLNNRDQLEVQFLLNMMSMYPEAPNHLKEQLLERLSLVYVATLFTWETAISLAIENRTVTNEGNSAK